MERGFFFSRNVHHNIKYTRNIERRRHVVRVFVCVCVAYLNSYSNS